MVDFLTVPDELLGVAEAVTLEQEASGFKVTVEDANVLGLPYLCPIVARRADLTRFIYVESSIPPVAKTRDIRGFCCSQTRSTQFCVALPATATITGTQMTSLRAQGIGILLVDSFIDSVDEILPPNDLTLSVSLPDLSRYPNAVRAVLGPSWDTLRRGLFLEGFDDACVAFESEVRKYIIRHKRGRMEFLQGNPPSDAQVRRRTMGQLCRLLADITNPNHADSQLLSILSALNDDRVRVAHKRRDGRSVGALRRNLGAHLWRIVQGVEHAIN